MVLCFRPATAGPRYRPWKVWMGEKYRQEALALQKAQSDIELEKRMKNDKAFQRWLYTKQQEDDDQSNSDDDDDDEDMSSVGTRTVAANDASTKKAYAKWCESKKDTFKRLDTRRKEMLEEGDFAGDKKSVGIEKRVTIFEIGDTDPTPMRFQDPTRYHVSFQKWKERRQKFLDWKKRNGGKGEGDESQYTKEEVRRMRNSLLLEGMTYEEWLGLKEREERSEKPYKNHTVKQDEAPIETHAPNSGNYCVLAKGE
jgi:hypothetical protein